MPNASEGPRTSPLSRLVRRLRSPAARRILSAGFFLAAAYLIYRQVAGMSLSGFLHALATTPPSAVAAAVVFTGASYLCLSGTEWLAQRALGHQLGYWTAAGVAVPAYALTNSAGFSPATGTALRIELYGGRGLSALQSAKIAMLAGAAVSVSGVVAAGIALVLDPSVFGQALHEGAALVALLGLVLIAPAGLWFVAFRPGAPSWLGGDGPSGLSARERLLGLGAGLGDWLFSGGALFVLLPHHDAAAFPSYFVAYVAGCLLSAATGVPGGIGVFEAIVLVLTALISQTHETAAALLLYRVIYSLAPLGLIALWGLGRRMARAGRGSPLPRKRRRGSRPNAGS